MEKEKRLEEIDSKITILRKKLHKKNLKFDYSKSKSFTDWEEYQEPEMSQLSKLDNERRMLMTPEFEDMPDYGDIMSLKDFIGTVNDGGFIDYDGSGNYVKDGKMSNITINPSDIRYGSIRNDFDTIIWFNR